MSLSNPKQTEPAAKVAASFEKRPDPHALTENPDPAQNKPSRIQPGAGYDYEPHPENAIELSAEQQKVVQSICNLYSASASEEDMQVYAKDSIYDDPWSYCDTRYKIAGQWYGIPKIFASSKTLKTEAVSAKSDEVIFKLQQEYTPKLLNTPMKVNSLVTLSLDSEGKVRYHKDMWNEKDYDHEGLGKIFKTLNGDHLTKVTRPPDTL